ncbi:MAG: c-type cytochrome [Anaerolineales bacterium]
MKGYITLGTVSVVAAIVFFAYLGATEQGRMVEFSQAFHARQIENGATLFANNCAPCHGEQGKGSPRAPGLNSGDLFNGTRLESIGWAGTLEDYLLLTISAGRPKASSGAEAYPERMPTWGQAYGGPLRTDQVQSLAAYIMNWKDRALAEAPVATLESADMVGIDFTVVLPEGDEERGKALASGALGCAACHILSNLGPAWATTEAGPGIGTRAQTRFQQEDYTGEVTSAVQYLFESIVHPNAYGVTGYEPDVMPATYATRMTPQDMADMIAYLLTFQ